MSEPASTDDANMDFARFSSTIEFNNSMSDN